MRTKNWNAALWTAQASMGALFGIAGFMKTTAPINELQMMIPWVADHPMLTRFVGVCEILGAIGLVLPSLLNIRPMLLLTTVRMLGLLMICAMFFHIIRGEFPMIGVNLFFLAILYFIAYGRSRLATFIARKQHGSATH